MLTFTNDQLRAKLKDALGADAAGIDFLPFPDLAQSVRDDVAALRGSPLLRPDTPVAGFIYDVATGRLAPVD
jgi:carbonic anhydrase